MDCNKISQFSFSADISNWNLQDSNPNASGFFAHGADGVLHATVLILFIFVAFDIMVVGPTMDFIGLPIRASRPRHRKIQYFGQTIERTIFLINTILCLSLVGMALALTIVQPIHVMVSNAQLDEFLFSIRLFWQTM